MERKRCRQAPSGSKPLIRVNLIGSNFKRSSTLGWRVIISETKGQPSKKSPMGEPKPGGYKIGKLRLVSVHVLKLSDKSN